MDARREVMAVRPEGAEGESEDDGEDAEVAGAEGERIRAEKETERTKSITDPRKPTEKEFEDHHRTHLPYRNWCPHCVRAKGKDLDHRKAADSDRGSAEHSLDHCFPGN